MSKALFEALGRLDGDGRRLQPNRIPRKFKTVKKTKSPRMPPIAMTMIRRSDATGRISMVSGWLAPLSAICTRIGLIIGPEGRNEGDWDVLGIELYGSGFIYRSLVFCPGSCPVSAYRLNIAASRSQPCRKKCFAMAFKVSGLNRFRVV